MSTPLSAQYAAMLSHTSCCGLSSGPLPFGPSRNSCVPGNSPLMFSGSSYQCSMTGVRSLPPTELAVVMRSMSQSMASPERLKCSIHLRPSTR